MSTEARVTADEGETVIVGRHSDALLRIDDPLVSREHLRVRRSDGRWIAEDLGSSNGTFVDRERVERVTIERETTIHLGAADGPWLQLTPESPDAAPTSDPPPLSLGDATLTIGRSSDCGLVLDDPLVSRHHAELEPQPGGRWRLVDTGSFNGTFVNGKRVESALLDGLDLVGIGSSQFRFTGSALEPVVRGEEVSLAAVGISVTSKPGVVLVDDVGFTLEEGSLLAVVGPSGAGKSTLLGALTGLRPPPRGSVYVGGRDLYAEYDDLRQRIGFVPQDDVVHPELTVRQSLEYAAELRFAPDVAAAERRARVNEVMAELGLEGREHLAVGKLSGGQRKRVSVAIELLTKPTLLFLDEPTSGLDPGLERSLMELLRSLADSGRTVVVVTHSTDSLNLCDRVLFLAPGGRTAYLGPPQLALSYFGRSDYQEVFREISAGSPEEWKERFAAHELGRRYLVEPLAGYAPGRREETPLGATLGRQRWTSQFSMLTRRYTRVLASDRANLLTLLGSAPLLGLMQLWRLPSGQFAALPPTQFRVVPQASLVLLVLAIGMTLMGLSASLREIVKELPVFRRERAVGLSISAYVLSKLTVLGLVVLFQAAVYISISTAFQRGPADAVVLGWPLGELIVAAALTGLAAVALGLMCSALVNSVNAAIALLPIILIVQLLIMQGGVFAQNKPVLHQLSYVSSAGWGFAAQASTVRLNNLQTLWNVAQQVKSVDAQHPAGLLAALEHPSRGNPHWNHQPGAWLRAVAALLLLTAAAAAIAMLVLRRFDPV